MKRIISIALLIAVLAATLSLTSCGNDRDVLESSKTEKKVVMTIDGFDVPLELYRYVALNLKADYEYGKSADIWLGDNGVALVEEINAQITDTLIRMYTTISLCADYGIKVDDKYVVDTVDILMDNVYESYEYDYIAYKNELKAVYMTDAVYRFIIRNDVMAEELAAKMKENGDIPTDSDELRAILDGDEFIRVKQILLSSDNGNTDEENLSLANKLLTKIQNGENFEDLIQKYGKDLFMFNNPDGYYLCRGTKYEEFENAAFDLAIGEVSGVVKTPAGYSIIKRYEKESAYIDKNFDALCEDYALGKYNQLLEAHMATLVATPTDEIANYSIFNLDSID